VAFGQLYAVAGNGVYRVDSNGNEVKLGEVADDGLPASITHNIFEVVVVSGGLWYTIQKDSGEFSTVSVVPVSHAQFLDG
jgi:hypothetical protein